MLKPTSNDDEQVGSIITPRFVSMRGLDINGSSELRLQSSAQLMSKSAKPVLLLKFENNLVSLNSSSVSSQCLSPKTAIPLVTSERFSIRSFLGSISTIYNVYLISSLDTEVLKKLASQLGIDLFIEGCIGNVSKPLKISGIDPFFPIKEQLNLSRTVLIDTEVKMIQLNKEIGILVSPLIEGKKDLDLLFLLPFLVYIAEEYESMTKGIVSQTRRKTEDLSTKKTTEKRDLVDETVADDDDRPISSMSNQSEAWKSVTTLKIEIGLSHLKWTQNLDKSGNLSMTHSLSQGSA